LRNKVKFEQLSDNDVDNLFDLFVFEEKEEDKKDGEENKIEFEKIQVTHEEPEAKDEDNITKITKIGKYTGLILYSSIHFMHVL
jgi:uroporphyrinogen-III synthase